MPVSSAFQQTATSDRFRHARPQADANRRAVGGCRVARAGRRRGPTHTHTREDETVYVLEGAITAFVGDQQIEVEAGSYAALPKGLPHGLKVRGDAARLLVTLAPAGAEYFFVPRDESDGDPAKFGLEIQGDAPRG